MGGLAHTLDGVATLTGALESADVEILDVEVRTDEQLGSDESVVFVTVRLPDDADDAQGPEEGDQSNVYCIQFRPSNGDGPTSVVSQPETESGDEPGSTESPDRADRRSDASVHSETESGSTAADGPDEAESTAAATGPAETEDDAGDDDVVPCRHDECDETFETERGMKIHFTKTHLEGAVTTENDDDDRPAYADPAKLRRVYEQYDTFEEMTDALDVEVTPATVRRHMIKYGIYDPADADGETNRREPTSSGSRHATQPRPNGRDSSPGGAPGAARNGRPDRDGADDTDPVAAIRDTIARRNDPALALPDDDELPDGVTVPDVIEAVVASQTMYQVAKHLETDRETARAALERLDLLDLVEGRLNAATTCEEREQKVAAKIEAMATPEATPQP
ncbi:MAG: hypothetical protein ACOCSF_03965 [Halanaeroarchaeum sp.]